MKELQFQQGKWNFVVKFKNVMLMVENKLIYYAILLVYGKVIKY